jgi:transcriptional regulator with XRE-family HTH domain
MFTMGLILDINIKEAYLTIGKNVKKYRKQKNISQLALALEMGYESVSIVSMSEVGARNKHFNIEHLLKIAKILQVDVCCFFEKVQEKIL